MSFSALFSLIAKNVPFILLAVLVFGLLIFVHELGHFITAKWSRIKVNEFAMGMGPVIWKRQKGETLYALRLFPIGGFCAMEGEDEESASSNAFGRAPLYKRMIVTIAGSVMNLLLGLLILAVLTSQQSWLGTTVISGFREGAVSNSRLMVGDEILRINNRRIRTDYDLIFELTRDRDGIMDIEVARETDGKTENVLIKNLQFNMQENEGVETIMIDFTVDAVKPTLKTSIKNAFDWTGYMIKQVWGGFIDLITGRYGFKSLSGPVGVTSAISQAASISWKRLMELVALITVNLAVFNMLPLPALDGGRMIFLLIEAVRRKPVNARYEGVIHAVGFIILVGLMIFVSINDVAKQISTIM